MLRSILVLMIASMGVYSTALSAQAPADCSGRWTVDDPAPPQGAPAASVRGDMGSGWGSPLTITQDAKQLTVEYTIYTRYDLQPPIKFVYALDGSESRNTLMMGRGTDVQNSHTVWDGSSLVITTAFTLPDPVSGKPFTIEIKQKLTLGSPTALVVEVTRSGVLGGRASTSKATYRKG